MPVRVAQVEVTLAPGRIARREERAKPRSGRTRSDETVELMPSDAEQRGWTRTSAWAFSAWLVGGLALLGVAVMRAELGCEAGDDECAWRNLEIFAVAAPIAFLWLIGLLGFIVQIPALRPWMGLGLGLLLIGAGVAWELSSRRFGIHVFLGAGLMLIGLGVTALAWRSTKRQRASSPPRRSEN